MSQELASEIREWKHRELEMHFLKPPARKWLSYISSTQEQFRVHAPHPKTTLLLGHETNLFLFLKLTKIAILYFKYITNIITFDPQWVYNVGTIIIPM